MSYNNKALVIADVASSVLLEAWWESFRPNLLISAKRLLDKTEIDFCESFNTIEEYDLSSFSSVIILVCEENLKNYDFLSSKIQQVGGTVFKLKLGEFVELEGAFQELYEFTCSIKDSSSENYWFLISDLLYELKYLNSGVLGSQGNVYLAYTADEMKGYRKTLRRELQHSGYNVFPDKTLPLDSYKAKAYIYECLEQCLVSVHIAHASMGEKKGVVEFQNQVAIDYCKSNSNKLKRFVWVDEVYESDEFSHLHLERLKRDKKVLFEAELILTPMVKFKDYIKSFFDSKKNVVRNNELGRQIYLIHDVSDKRQSEKLIQILETKGFLVVCPDFESGKVSNLSEHRRKLSNCESLIVYHSGRNSQWVDMKMLDLLKAPGYGRQKMMKSKALYLEEPLDLNLSPEELNVITINGKIGDITEESLAPFLKELENNEH